jgi:hypothetical protein
MSLPDPKEILDKLVLNTVLLLRPHTHRLSRTLIVRTLCPDFNAEDEKAVSASLQRLKKAGMVYHLDYGVSGWFPTPAAESGPCKPQRPFSPWRSCEPSEEHGS